MFSSADHAFMAQALRLAERGMFSANPNPRVGCVVVQAGRVVGSGWHERAGQSHAEVNALNVAGLMARGATVYVTLEPCSHYGLTPPCVEALKHAGISKVVMAMEDPNPLVSGKGCALLRQSGIDVQSGLLGAEARALNIGFVSRMLNKRPWIRSKVAASLDGKIALKNGLSQWITGKAARQDGHRWRARSCAILTGIGTVKADDPQLSVREIKTSRQPLKVVIDRRLETPADARLLFGKNVLIFTTDENAKKADVLRKKGAQVISMPDEHDKVDLVKMMHKLADFGINELLVEAGNKLNGALVRADLIDELVIFLAPHLLGETALGLIDLPELTSLDQKSSIEIQDLRMIGKDIRIIAKFLRNNSACS
jgi:diaminohydroxyphosphoribosylaminopyrimidine deaminase / 5-amino-6-(5-phosphoribosylamino)uracil reductase